MGTLTIFRTSLGHDFGHAPDNGQPRTRVFRPCPFVRTGDAREASLDSYRACATRHAATAIARDPIGCYRGGMRRKAGQLEQIRSKRIGDWIDDLKPGSRAAHRALDEFENPGRWTIRRMVDEELADLIASEPGSKLGTLAASELRTREAWRGPARWSLIIAALAFAVSLVAFIRTI